MCPQLLQVELEADLGNHEGREELAALRAEGGHCRLADVGASRKNALDLARLHAVPPDLDLRIDPAEVEERAVWLTADQIASAIEALSGVTGDCDEPLCRFIWALEITLGDRGAADQEFRGDTIGDGAVPGVPE